MVWPHQWDIVAGIPSPPEKGCGQSSLESPIVAVLNIGEALVPCAWMICVVHAQNVYDHPIDNLCLAINLRMEGYGLSEFGVWHRPKIGPK